MSAPRRPGGDDRRPARPARRPAATRIGAPGTQDKTAKHPRGEERPRASAGEGKPTRVRAPGKAGPQRDEDRPRATSPRAARAEAFRANSTRGNTPSADARPTGARAPVRGGAGAQREDDRPVRTGGRRPAPGGANPGFDTGRRAPARGPGGPHRDDDRGPSARPVRAGGRRPAAGAAVAPIDTSRSKARQPAPRTSAPAVARAVAPRPGARSKEPQRIAKLLARAGIASRREVERLIEEGRVAIEGVVLDTPATLLTSLHGVTVDGEPVAAAAPARLFLFNKPTGFLTTERDPRGRPTIYDRLPKDLPRVMPVGRLDMNTEGLLLLTTDGELKRKLELPSTGIPRVYRARAYGEVTQDQLEQLIEGVEIEGVRYGQIDANLERRTGRNVWIEMKLTEGKNREVRRVLEYLGLQVSRLIRTSYGEFVLADLAPGGVAEVRQHDLVAFRQTLK